MARTTGSDGERTEAAIRAAAVSLIARHGYAAVSMRQLATEVGVQAAALYRYFPTKEDLLFTLMREHMQDLAVAWHSERPATLDPVAIIKNRQTAGGPQPSEMDRMLKESMQRLAQQEGWIKAQRAQVASSLARLDADFEKLGTAR